MTMWLFMCHPLYSISHTASMVAVGDSLSPVWKPHSTLRHRTGCHHIMTSAGKQTPEPIRKPSRHADMLMWGNSLLLVMLTQTVTLVCWIPNHRSSGRVSFLLASIERPTYEIGDGCFVGFVLLKILFTRLPGLSGKAAVCIFRVSHSSGPFSAHGSCFSVRGDFIFKRTLMIIK